MGRLPVPDLDRESIDRELPPYVLPEGDIPLEWAFSESDAEANRELLTRALLLSPAEHRDLDPLRQPGTDRPARTAPLTGTTFASSHVVRHLWRPLDQVVEALGSAWPTPRRRWATLTRTGSGPAAVDADLWRLVPLGRVPVRLDLRPWNPHHTIVDLHLRPDRAPRLPRLYFAAAHRALDDLLGALGDFRPQLARGATTTNGPR